MSNETIDVVGLIDAALKTIASEEVAALKALALEEDIAKRPDLADRVVFLTSTKCNLREFQKQAKASQLQSDDRDYVVALCNRLLRGPSESYEYPKPTDNQKLEAGQAEEREKWIECHRQAGRFFQAKRDMKWLYFDLVLKGALEDGQSRGWKGWDTGDHLQSLIYLSFQAGDWARIEAAHYIDWPMFHCTTLRDLFIIRLIEALATHIRDPVKSRLVFATRIVIVVFVLLLALALDAFVNWWAAAAVLFLLSVKVWGWYKELGNMMALKIGNRCTRATINEIAAMVSRGGFDEPTIIRQLEILDSKIPPLPKIVKVYGLPYPLGSDPTGIQEHTIPIPDVLYALLRLPRRHVESELSKTVLTLNEKRRNEIEHGWRTFVDRLLKYDEA